MKKSIRAAIFITGLSGIVGQMVLLREMLIVFSGNEFSIGIVLANWLILEAFGCYFLGKKAEYIKNKVIVFAGIGVLFAISLPFMIYFTRMLRTILGLAIGQGIGILPILYASFLILLPVSVLHGTLFTFGCKIYSAHNRTQSGAVGRVYVYEIIGTIVGGVAWTYLLIPYLHSFHVAAGIAFLNFCVAVALLIPYMKTGDSFQRISALVACLLLLSNVYILVTNKAEDIHQNSIERQWAPHYPLQYQNSKYGNLCVIEKEGQYTLFVNGLPHIVSPIPDIASIEEFVHLPILVHPDPNRILVLSGGAGGVIHESLKHASLKKIDYTELDPLVLEMVEKFPTELTKRELSDERVSIRHIDGRLFLKETSEEYDLIFVGLDEPTDLQTNRFFTEEFFSLAKIRLKDEGIIVLRLPGSLTFLSEELKNLNASVYNALREVFSNVRVLPGEGSNLFLASDSEGIIHADTNLIGRRIFERELRAEIIVPRNIVNKLHPGWSGWFTEFIDGSTQRLNRDFRPLGLFYNISHWNAIFTPALRGIFRWFEKLDLRIFFAVFTIFVLLFILLRKIASSIFGTGVSFVIGTTGFAGMIFDLTLIFVFQVIYGYVFTWIGLLVTAFMAGSAAGAIVMNSYIPRIKRDVRCFVAIDIIIVCFTLLLPVVFMIIQPFLDSPAVFHSIRFVILLLSFLGGLLVGAQFPLANKIYLEKNPNLSKTAGLLYGSDLLGGWLGGILGGVILLPILGLLGTCLVVVLIKLCSLIVTAYLNYKGL